MQIYFKTYYSLLALIVALVATSCSTTKNIEQGQSILTKISLDIDPDYKSDFNQSMKYELESLYSQRPITRSFWNPRNWFGEQKIEVLSNKKTEKTRASLQNFLRNKKGFYHCIVTDTVIIKKQKAKIVYNIQPNKRYHIDTIKYISADKNLLLLIDSLKTESLIKVGQPLDAGLFNLEKLRITRSFQNLGYANFQANYISFEGDSLNNKVKVIFKISTPANQNFHQKYSIGKIQVFTEDTIKQSNRYSLIDTLNNKIYYAKSKKFLVKPSSIENALYLNKGIPYNRDLHTKSFRKLSELSTYRFVNIIPDINAKNDSILDFNIVLKPHNQKWIMDIGLETFFTSGSSSVNKLFGISANTRFQDRNFAGGSELYTLNLEGSLEFNIDTSATNLSFGVENNFELPKFKDLFGLAGFMHNHNIISEHYYESLRQESKTNINISYNFSSIYDRYTTHSLGATFGYDYRPNLAKRILFNPLSLKLLIPKTKPGFEEILANNTLLKKSFEPYLTSGIFFNNLAYVYQGKPDRGGNQFSLLGFLELSGVEAYAVNTVYDAFSKSSEEWELWSINFSKFAKIEVDDRYYKNFRSSQFATRLDMGIAVPFGGDKVIPYFAQFYLGGPNSLRAWQIRELGPGQYHTVADTTLQSFYQAGDIKLEFSFEYRWDMFWLIEGAVFLDVGNIWTLRDDESRPLSKITSSFYNEFAVGSGWGLRLDLTYFLIRADFGYKLRNPYPNSNGDYWDTSTNNPLGNINIAINYPF